MPQPARWATISYAVLAWLPLGIFARVIVQYATANMRDSADLQLLAALHPVTGFAITWRTRRSRDRLTG